MTRKEQMQRIGLLYTQYRRELECYARKCLNGHSDMAYDVVMEVFLRLAKMVEAGTLNLDEKTERAYLFRAVRNMAIDALKREVRVAAQEIPDDFRLPADPIQRAREWVEDLVKMVYDEPTLTRDQKSAFAALAQNRSVNKIATERKISHRKAKDLLNVVFCYLRQAA